MEHEVIHPLMVILGDNDLFGVITLTYDTNFKTFASKAAESLEKTEENASLNEFPHDQKGGIRKGRSAFDNHSSLAGIHWVRDVSKISAVLQRAATIIAHHFQRSGQGMPSEE